MIETYLKPLGDSSYKKIKDFQMNAFIYAEEATLDDLAKIAELTLIPLDDIRDSLDKYELPRIEKSDDNVIFFLRHPATNDQSQCTETLTLILATSCTIAISPHRSELIETLLNTQSVTSNHHRTKFILNILHKITQDFTNSIKRFRHSILGFEEPLQDADSNAIIVLTKNEEILNQYLTSLVPMRNLLETMASGKFLKFNDEDLDLLEDLMIAMHQSEDVCRVNIKSIRSLRDSYHIIFTNDVNRTIKLLTAVTIIFTIPTVIASIYGMNVVLPFQSHPQAFYIIMSLTALTSIVAVALFRRNRWL